MGSKSPKYVPIPKLERLKSVLYGLLKLSVNTIHFEINKIPFLLEEDLEE